MDYYENYGGSIPAEILINIGKNDLPSSTEAEEALISSLLNPEWNQRLFMEITGIIKPDVFHNELLFELAKVLWLRFGRRQAVDPIIIREKFIKIARAVNPDNYSDDDATDYLTNLALLATNAKSGLPYAELLADLYSRRQMIFFARQVVEDARSMSDSDGAESIYSASMKTLQSLRSTFASSSHFVRLDEAMDNAMRSIGEEGTMGMSTGIKEIDKAVNGLHRGDLFSIGGRPRMGKTSLAMSIMRHVSSSQVFDEGKSTPRRANVLFFSLEMAAEAIAIRSASALARLKGLAEIEYQDIISGNIDPEEKQLLIDLVPEAAQLWPIHIDATSGLTTTDIISRTRAFSRKHGPVDLVAIDYVQRLSFSDTTGQSEHKGIDEALKMMADFAKEDALCCMVLSQLTREVDRRDGNIPVIADMRGSGGWEEHSTIMQFLVRHEVYLETKPVPKPHEDKMEHLANLADARDKATIYTRKNKRGGEGEMNIPHEIRFDLMGVRPDSEALPFG